MTRKMIAMLACLLIHSGLYSQTTSATTTTKDDFVVWGAPAISHGRPQTEAEKEVGMTAGRLLPQREILQPTVDPKLEDYQPRANGQLSGTVRSAVSDVLPLLAQSWIEAFRKYYPAVNIIIDKPYAGSLGAKELVAGKVDFVIVSRELKPDDLIEFKAKYNYDLLSVPVSGGSYRHYGFLDAVVFFVNKDNPLQQLSFDQLDAMYSRTHYRGGEAITKWGQLGISGEWADKPIHLYGIQPWNGFEEFVRQRVLSVSGKRGEWRNNIHYDKLVMPLAERVAGDPYGVGFAGLAYVDHGVRILALSPGGNARAISPTYTNVALATYPLSRLIYLNTNKAPGKPMNPIVEEFLRFILSKQGQQVVHDEGLFMPLRKEQVDAALSLVR